MQHHNDDTAAPPRRAGSPGPTVAANALRGVAGALDSRGMNLTIPVTDAVDRPIRARRRISGCVAVGGLRSSLGS